MASELRVNTLKDAAGNNSVGMTYVANGSAKAWLSLNGTGTISITGSFNITSTVDDATGTYTANYTSNMSAVDYAVSGSLTNNSNVMHCVSAIAASSFKTIHRDFSNTLTDTKPLSSVDGDLA